MACTYTFKNRTFNSELELDSFLLERFNDYEKYGDIVFSQQTTPQSKSFQKLLKLKKESDAHWKAYLEIRRNIKDYGQFDWDGEETFEKLPYIGVTKYLSKKKIDGKHLHPEFIEKNYWTTIFARWKRGIFGKTEQELRGYKENDTALTEEQCNELKKEIEERWRNQSAIGTAIHNVLQIYFSQKEFKNSDGSKEYKYYFELDNKEELIKQLVRKENKQYVEEHIDQIIKYAESLHNNLKRQLHDDNLHFFTEYVAHAKIEDDKVNDLLGSVDLIVIDSTGKTHILDYKTSIKDYSEFRKNAKELAYKYQMFTYQQMLETSGINMFRSRLFVAPIRIDGFKKDDSGKYIFDSINGDHGAIDLTLNNMETIERNVYTFLPPKFNFSLEPNDTLAESEEFMSGCFESELLEKSIDEKSTKWFLEKQGYLKKDDTGNFVYKIKGKVITSEDEADFIKKVTEFRKTLDKSSIRLAGSFVNILEDAIKEKSADLITFNSKNFKEDAQSLTWVKDTLGKYTNGEWEIWENGEFYLNNFGIIGLVNKNNKIIDFIKIDTSYLSRNYRAKYNRENKLHNRNALTAKWETDAQVNSKAKSMMLEAAVGNVELMRMMAIINSSNWQGDLKIGSMAVMNPYDQEIIQPSNIELLYSFNELNKHNPMKWNRFESGEIQLTNKVEDAYYTFKEIINSHDLGPESNDYFKKTLNGCTSVLDDLDTNSKEEKIKALRKLLNTLESHETQEIKYGEVYKTQGQIQNDAIRLRNSIITAINSLKGIDFRQQLQDHGDWYQSLLIHRNGLQGNKIDNPGNLQSATLNLITLLTKQAYQNTRSEVLEFKNKLDKYIKNIKEESNFGYVKENIGFNQVDLYKNLYTIDSNGDFMFKRLNDSTLSNAQRDLLEFALDKINTDIYGKELADQMLANDDDAYYRVPIAQGSRDSNVSVQGWFGALKNKLKGFTPKQIYNRAEKKIQGIEYDDSREDPKTFVWKMTNMFDSGNTKINSLEKRLRLIQENKIENLEHNLETLLLKHTFAYSQQRNIDEVFPLMKGAAIHLQQQGANVNKYFKNDLQYFQDYIWNKVLNKSLIPPNQRNVNRILSLLKQGATKFALAFSPVQGMYQSIQGLWQYVSLAFRNPDYNKSFTFAHFQKAFRIVYRDLLDFSGNPTLISRLNELYAINDMDMNSFIERISKNKKGIYNMDNFAMKFASRPDYYNRMIILVSQMLADGSFEAHSLVNGKLVYDWTKDKRFSKYAANPTLKTNDPEYNKQKSLYYAIASQLVDEGVKDENGNAFELNMQKPNPLPRSYSNKQMEGMKSLADDIYGYYSHENKSLMMSTLVGSMWLQFKTYWSGKKNQYLQSGGIRQRGRWEQLSEEVTINGKKETIKWYYRLDENGNPDYNLPPIPDKKPNENYVGILADTAEKQIAPCVQWKGQWQEGIALSVAEIFKSKNIKQNFVDAWTNSDPDLQKAFQNNIKQLGFDLFMFFVVGSILGSWLSGWLDDLEDEKKDQKDFITGLQLSAAKISVMSVKNSFQDLNFFKSIGSPIQQWTPFAFDYWGRVVGRYADVAMGEKNWYDTLVSNFAVGNQMKPMFDVFKPNSLRSKREGGTWESASAKKNREKRENK